MLSDDFAAWAARVAALTGFPPEALVEWAGVLAAEGYHAAELHDAADWLLARDPPPFRLDFFRALTDRLRRRRQEKRAAEAARCREADQRAACPDCGGVGWCYVPGWEAGDEDREVCLPCGCPQGLRHLDGLDASLRPKGKAPLSLAAYEKMRPTWRKEKARRAEVAKARRAAEDNAAGMDGRLGPAIRRIMKRLKAKETEHGEG